MPTAFEGLGAAAGIAAALARATAALDGCAPDVLLMVRGGGTAAGLRAALLGTARLALDAAGHDHIAPLINAALAGDIDGVSVARGSYARP